MLHLIQEHVEWAALIFLGFVFSVIIFAVEIAIMRRMRLFTAMFDRALMVMQSFDTTSAMAELRQMLQREETRLGETQKLAQKSRDRLKTHDLRLTSLEKKVFPLLPHRADPDEDTKP